MQIDGRCHCGHIAYEAEIDPDNVSICHCTDCQNLTGSAYRVTVSTAAANFHITQGQPKLYVKTGQNGARRLQFFCPDCGSPLYTTGEGGDAGEVGIRLGTVTQRRNLPPKRQIWCRSALEWVGHIDGLPGVETD
ncbi:GFA family protein [Pararhizobium sp.]|uniref:GFA family protein n=1 Tax=Pararhizobium sp. TaxID=1977563 RepID=UPI0027160B28|nr:GFA family protein [Pararhizobium sp.]MDO9417689.1 GFA family protein [Pararhizobium sp.]